MSADREKAASSYETEGADHYWLLLLFVGLGIVSLAAAAYILTLGYDLGPLLGKGPFLGKKEIAIDRAVPRDFTPFYRKHSIDPIDPDLLDKTITDNLLALEKNPCDWPAVEAAGTALFKKNAKREAANIYLGFSQSCPSDGYAERIAASLFLDIKDFEKARALFTSLTTRFPGNETDWYQKGLAEQGLGMTDKALQSFANTISLVNDQKMLGEQVFTALSAVYAQAGRFCEAMTPISTYMSLDPARRDTPRTHAMLENLSQQGNCTSYATGTDSFPVFNPGVISVKAQINGVAGTFVVDTGASFVALNQDFAGRAKISGGDEEMFFTANGQTTGQVAKANTIKLGKLQANDVPLVILPKAAVKGFDGLLGRSFLSRFEMTVTGSRLTLTTK